MSAPCLLWCWYIFCRWRYVFYLSLDPTKPLRWDVRRIYGWELLAACHHTETILKRKNTSSKTSYKYTLILKEWVGWITTRREENVTEIYIYIYIYIYILYIYILYIYIYIIYIYIIYIIYIYIYIYILILQSIDSIL